MHAILNRSTILAAGIALGTLIVLLAILPGQADGAAAASAPAAALSAPIHQDEALSAEESDAPVYPGAGHLNTPGEAPGRLSGTGSWQSLVELAGLIPQQLLHLGHEGLTPA